MAGQYMPTFAVVVNHYEDDSFSNDQRCDLCSELATVINMGGVWVCAGCLSCGQRFLEQEVLFSKLRKIRKA